MNHCLHSSRLIDTCYACILSPQSRKSNLRSLMMYLTLRQLSDWHTHFSIYLYMSVRNHPNDRC